ncbi:MAG: putative DNA modification/repair radical SAM protein [Phycisphaerae bacterium]
MNISQKLEILADAAKYDASCASSGSKRSNNGLGLGNSDGVGICHSYTPDGRCVSLLKILLTNYCIYDCKFCVNRVTSEMPRARFTPAEVVFLAIEFYKRNYIEGLFLSSGIIQSPDYTMEQLVTVARRLREEENFCGYIHLKAIPGADPTLLAQAGRYADRLSANIELPTDKDLQALAPEKSLDTVDRTMSIIRDRRAEAVAARKAQSRAAPRFVPAGQSTQMIVGATETTDGEILRQSATLYRRQRLRRVYYSAFSPIPAADRLLPAISPPLIREHRLYQADWLMRFYKFSAEEIAPRTENLSLDVDPKAAWALRNRDFFPVDINQASREALLRVPGLGVRNVGRILKIRRHRRLRLEDLRRLGVSLKKVSSFVVATDRNRATRALQSDELVVTVKGRTQQLELFAATQSARSGEL